MAAKNRSSIEFVVPPSALRPRTATFKVGKQRLIVLRPDPAPRSDHVRLAKSGTLGAGIRFKNNGDGTATISGTALAGSEGTYKVVIGVVIGKDRRRVATLPFTLRIANESASAFKRGTGKKAGAFKRTTSKKASAFKRGKRRTPAKKAAKRAARR